MKEMQKGEENNTCPKAAYEMSTLNIMECWSFFTYLLQTFVVLQLTLYLECIFSTILVYYNDLC